MNTGDEVAMAIMITYFGAAVLTYISLVILCAFSKDQQCDDAGFITMGTLACPMVLPLIVSLAAFGMFYYATRFILGTARFTIKAIVTRVYSPHG